MKLIGIAKRDFLRYIYHTEEGLCHTKNNITIEESAMQTFNNLFDKDRSLKYWICRELDIVINTDLTIEELNNLYNKKHDDNNDKSGIYS